MAKSSQNASGLFSTRELQRIYEFLKSKSFEGYWEVGRILNENLGERAPYGELQKLKDDLAKFRGDAPTSLAQLHQCRRLNATWSRKDAKDADRAGLPWERAFALIYIWSAAKRRHQSEVVARCKELVAEYARLGWKKKGPWNAEVKALKSQARGGDGFISSLRLLGEKREAVVLRLKAAAQLIDDIREFLPAEAHDECSELKKQAEGLISMVEALCEKHMQAGA